MSKKFSLRYAVSCGVLGISCLVLMGSDGGGCCGKCQDEIDHMAANIGQWNCDPSRMERAASKIRDECVGNSETVIGNLVEQCHSDRETPRVYCDESNYSYFPVECVNDGYEEVYFGFYVTGSGAVYSELLYPGESQTLGVPLHSGANIDIVVEDREREEFSFWLSNYPTWTIRSQAQWTPYRMRTVTFIQPENSIEFENF